MFGIKTVSGCVGWGGGSRFNARQGIVDANYYVIHRASGVGGVGAGGDAGSHGGVVRGGLDRRAPADRVAVEFQRDIGAAVERQQSFELAMKHVNEGGGVLGRPVEWVVVDSTLDPEAAVSEARRLVDEEGIHALVGPSTSATSLQVVERVTGPGGIPTISPSATSPLLTDAADHDFFFRTALSDSAQGPVVAKLVRDQGFSNVGLIYRNDAWGNGLLDAFRGAWTGGLQAVPIEPGETTLLPQLRQSADQDAEALVLMTFDDATLIAVRESLENGLYDQFVIVETSFSEELQGLVGEAGGRAYGTAPGASTAQRIGGGVGAGVRGGIRGGA